MASGSRNGAQEIQQEGWEEEGVAAAVPHRRAATGNTRGREAPGTAGGPRSLGQRPEIRHTPWLLGC
jgi:hypothetical protein